MRHVSAVLVAIALVAAQIMPAWAGCHAQRHAGAAMADAVMVDAPGHHGMSHFAGIEADLSAATDQKQSPQKDVCPGTCGCACGVGGAFLLASVTAIDAPQGAAPTPEFAARALPLGDRPDGPRRPPRTTA